MAVLLIFPSQLRLLFRLLRCVLRRGSAFSWQGTCQSGQQLLQNFLILALLSPNRSRLWLCSGCLHRLLATKFRGTSPSRFLTPEALSYPSRASRGLGSLNRWADGRLAQFVLVLGWTSQKSSWIGPITLCICGTLPRVHKFLPIADWSPLRLCLYCLRKCSSFSLLPGKLFAQYSAEFSIKQLRYSITHPYLAWLSGTEPTNSRCLVQMRNFSARTQSGTSVSQHRWADHANCSRSSVPAICMPEALPSLPHSSLGLFLVFPYNTEFSQVNLSCLILSSHKPLLLSGEIF